MVDINEETNITPEQYNQFLPKQRFNIPKSTIQKVKSCITSLNTGLVSNNFSSSASTPFSFVINPNNQAVIDLSQCYFNVAGTLRIKNDEIKTLDTKDIKFGNLFLSSLFQQATLSMGGAIIALNANPGVDANLQAMLKFDAYDLVNKSLSDREFLLNKLSQIYNESTESITLAGDDFTFANGYSIGYTGDIYGTVPQNNARKNMIYIYETTSGGTNIVATTSGGTVNNIKLMIIKYNDSGNGTAIILKHDAVGTANILVGQKNTADVALNNSLVFGIDDRYAETYTSIVCQSTTNDGNELSLNIPFRCKLYLSDLFNYTVDSLDYVFNREINITLQRSSISSIIANVISPGGNIKTAMDVKEISKFELVCFSYLLTDTARKQLIQYYSKPVETLYGIQTTNLTPLYSTDESQTEQNITLPLTVNYDTKCIILAFPKCSNPLVPLSTPQNYPVIKTIQQAQASGLVDKCLQLSWYGSNSNSYNFAGLNYIRISNTSNSNIYYYDFNGTAMKVVGTNTYDKGFDISNSTAASASTILDYREAYEQYKQLRLLFGKDPDNAIAYADYLKDYCIIPIDLTGSNIPPNTRIFVQFQFANWGKATGDNATIKYNPFHYGNVSSNSKLSTNLLAIFLGSDVLEYRPDGTCIVKHILTAGSNEKTVNIK